MDDLYARKITLRSDEAALRMIANEGLSAYIKEKKEAGMVRLKRLLLFLALLILAVYLNTIDPGFATLIAIAVMLLALLSAFEIYTRVADWLTLKKHQSEFRKWVAKNKEVPFVHYKLYDDRLEYEGEENTIFPWSGFTAIHERDDHLILSTSKTVAAVWIPKSVLVNSGDFGYFRDFARGKIEKENPSQLMPGT